MHGLSREFQYKRRLVHAATPISGGSYPLAVLNYGLGLFHDTATGTGGGREGERTTAHSTAHST